MRSIPHHHAGEDGPVVAQRDAGYLPLPRLLGREPRCSRHRWLAVREVGQGPPGGVEAVAGLQAARGLRLADVQAVRGDGGGHDPVVQAGRALSAATQTPRFEGRTVTRNFARKATAFLARDGIVLYDNPDAFLICAFKRDNALCEPDPGATAPRQYDCRPGCGNSVRTDTHARNLRQRANELDGLATRVPGPIAKRLMANAAQLRATADTHDTTAESVEALA
ncbi:hypothetical protein [Streptomyces sp. NPDC047525]|uniref:hypothetical protein n=1 Tax=Streptomyces sp. NPDC047525 TaxID=3155264 RepID=UPI00340678E5